MMEQEKSTRRRRKPSRLWREAIANEARSERSRVVPLPLAFAALMLPFLAAWAAAAPQVSQYEDLGSGNLAAASREIPLPLRELGRTDRAPRVAGTYVDVWGRTSAWEADALRRRGYVRPGR